VAKKTAKDGLFGTNVETVTVRVRATNRSRFDNARALLGAYDRYEFDEAFAREFLARLDEVSQTRLKAAEHPLDAEEKSALEQASSNLRPQFDALAQLIEPHRAQNPARLSQFFRVIQTIMDNCFDIGWSVSQTRSARAYVKAAQAAVAQEANSKEAGERHAEIKAAILKMEKEKGLRLCDSYKYAQSLRLDLADIPGVKENKRGYSARTFHRVIQTILQERKSF
jgi:hypothetical protein